MKKLISITLALLTVLTLVGCGKEQPAVEDGTSYILTGYHPMPDSITTISGSILDGERILMCCWEEADPENCGYYIASMHTDGSGFEKLIETQAGEIPLDLAADGYGGLWVIFTAEDEEAGNSYILRQYDSQGSMIAELPLTKTIDRAGALKYLGRTVYLNTDSEGRVYVTVKNAKTYCFIYDSLGDYLGSLTDAGNPMGAITTAQGQVAIFSTKDGGYSYSLVPINKEGTGWDEAIELGEVMAVFDGAGQADYYVYDRVNFSANISREDEGDRMFAWADLGLPNGDIHVFPQTEGRFLVLAGSFSQSQLLYYEFCSIEPGQDDRTVLTMLSLEPSDSIREAVALFNKSSRDYRVELTDYSYIWSKSGEPDWDQAIMKLNTELISGKIPDIIDLEGLPYMAYSRRGLLEDLYPYLERDPNIDMDDYFQNVFQAMSIDGKLPYVTSSVRVFTMFAPPEVVGSQRGWTLEKFQQLRDDGILVVDGLEPARFLELLMAADEDFVDWQTGTCSFDDPRFIELLELCRTMDAIEGGDPSLMGEGISSCAYTPLFSAVFVAEANARFGGNAVPIGFPSVSGEPVHILATENRIGFSATCQHKDGAWAFVRSFLEPRMQESGISFPYLKSSFEKITQAAVAGNTIWRGGMYNGPITDRDVELTREILSGANYCLNSDRGLSDLIVEMASEYFSGQKSAQEVCRDLQQRATLYLAEQK